MSDDKQWPQQMPPPPTTVSAEQLASAQAAKRAELEADQLERKLEHEDRWAQIEELKARLEDREDHIQKADKVINRINSELQGMTSTAKQRWKTIKRLEQCLQTANNKIDAKEETVKRQAQVILGLEEDVRELKGRTEGKDQQIERQAQTIDRLTKEVSDCKDTIDHLDAELDRYKEMPNATDNRAHIAAVNTLRDKGYTYTGGVFWKPPLGQPPKHLLETDNATENAVLALSELDEVLQRRGIDNKACAEALAYYFSARAKRRT